MQGNSSLEEAADTEYIVHCLVRAPVYTNENHESKTHTIGAQTGFSCVGTHVWPIQRLQMINSEGPLWKWKTKYYPRPTALLWSYLTHIVDTTTSAVWADVVHNCSSHSGVGYRQQHCRADRYKRAVRIVKKATKRTPRLASSALGWNAVVRTKSP